MTASQWFAAHQRQARLGTIEVAAAREPQPMSVCLGFLADKKLDEHTEEVNGAPLGDAARPPCSVLLQNSRPPRRCCSACHLQRAAPRPYDRRRRVHSSTRRPSGCQGVTRLAATKSPNHKTSSRWTKVRHERSSRWTIVVIKPKNPGPLLDGPDRAWSHSNSDSASRCYGDTVPRC